MLSNPHATAQEVPLRLPDDVLAVWAWFPADALGGAPAVSRWDLYGRTGWHLVRGSGGAAGARLGASPQDLRRIACQVFDLDVAEVYLDAARWGYALRSDGIVPPRREAPAYLVKAV